MRVQRFRNSLFALVAFLWLPVSAHCQLESIPGMDFLRCGDETPASHQPARDCSDCCAIEKSQYRADHVRLTIPTPDLLPVLFTSVVSAADTLPAEVSLVILTVAPPDLPQRWHFLSRAALPVRAPSLAS
jgi:hypothetical protein